MPEWLKLKLPDDGSAWVEGRLHSRRTVEQGPLCAPGSSLKLLGQQERFSPVLQDLLHLAAFSLHAGGRGSSTWQFLFAFVFMHAVRLRDRQLLVSASWANNQLHWVNAQTSPRAWREVLGIEVVPVVAEIVVRCSAVQCILSCRLAVEPEGSAL